jgi:putative aldouronate transport system substrate-binding protein
VSAKLAHVTEAARWLDVAYGEWGKRLFNFGIEGTSYTLVRGAPVLVSSITSDLARGGAVRQSTWEETTWEGLYRYTRGMFGGPFDVSAELFRQEVEALMPDSGRTIMGWAASAQTDPLATMEDDQDTREELERLLLPLRDYTNRQMLRFITGQRPLSETGRFARELDERGLGRCLEILSRADRAWRSKVVLLR